MNEEKLTLKREKSNKASQAKGGKPKEKSVEQAMANELSETQSTFEPGGNPNIELYTKHPERSYSLKESLKNYLMIKNNNYLNRARKVPTEDDILKCECVPGNAIPKRINPETSLSLDCGKKCLNSIISIECDASVCPCGSRCQNRKFQRHQNAKVYPIQFGDKGFGLVAAEFIPKETFIIQYIGEVLSLNSEIGKKRLQEYSKSTCTYMMRLSSKEVIDPTYKGNMARFINHSCDPNCETRKWNVRGEIEVGIISVKDIQEGEELTFDYKFDVYQTPFTRCLCGTSKCKGYLGLVPVEYTLEEWEEKIDNLPCEICGSTSESNHNQLLLCDFCNNGFHMLCCDPPIVEIPQGAWFCKKCSLGGDVDMQPIVEKPVEEKIEQKSTAYIKPVKQMLLNDKKLRNYYIKQKRKGLKVILEKDENDQDDPEEEFLKPYNEFYAFQNQIQTEVIYEFLDEIKVEKRDAERSTKERMATESTQDKKRDNDTEDKVLDEALNVEDDLDEEEPTSRVDEPQKAANLQPEPAQTEAKNAYDKIKVEITNQFSKTFANSEIYKNLNDNQYLAELNKQGEIARKVMPISSVELTLFQSLCRLVTKAMPSAKLFWNNSHAFHPDVFAKTIEFTITGTAQQANLVRDIFKLMEDAINWYKRVSGFTTATIFVPAIYLKRVVGEFQKNIHYVENVYQVRTHYDKRFITDDTYPLHEKTPLTMKGIKENILRARDYLQNIVNELCVYRKYMSSSEIKVIISNLITIKQNIHPSEVRCCRDNALRDINHPFFTIYYKDKEVAFVGTEKEIELSMNIVESEIKRAKTLMKNFISLNYLLPICDKSAVVDIKGDLEANFRDSKMIIYEPLHPRKNISITLSSTYENYEASYNFMKQRIEEDQLFNEKFEHYQIQTLYQMSKYFFKYLQNYFQTKSVIFMKAWDTLSSEFSTNCNQYESSFKLIKGLYIRDHELKFYILSVNRMGYTGTYRDVGLNKMDIIVILKSIANKCLLFDQNLVTKNYQSIFNYGDDLVQFLHSYNPKSYFNDYCNERISEFERKLRHRLLTPAELEKDDQVSFPRKEMTARDKFRSKDSRATAPSKAREQDEELDATEVRSRESKESEPIADNIGQNQLTKMVSAPPKLDSKFRDSHNFKDPRYYKQGQRPPYFRDPGEIRELDQSPKREAKQVPKRRQKSSESSSSSKSSSTPKKKKARRRHESPENKKSESRSLRRQNKKSSKRASSSSSGGSSSSNKSSESSLSSKSKDKQSLKKKAQERKHSSTSSDSDNVKVYFKTSHHNQKDQSKLRYKDRSRSNSKSKHKGKYHRKKESKYKRKRSSSSSLSEKSSGHRLKNPSHNFKGYFSKKHNKRKGYKTFMEFGGRKDRDRRNNTDESD